MLTLVFTYLVLAFGALVALAVMILRIGAILGTCPQSGTTARAAAVTVATGFSAIGAGGVVLIGAGLPLASDAPMGGLLFALGLASLCLGMGFTNAVATLRGALTVKEEMPPAQVVPAADPVPEA